MTTARSILIMCLLLALGLVGFLAGGTLQTTHAMPESAVQGWQVWRDYQCESCHTIYGLGGIYGPDLTESYEQRGADYLRDFMLNPPAFYPNQRLMPRFTLTQTEIDHLIDFLRYVGSTGENTPNVQFPPRPIQVAGTGGLSVAFAPSTDSGSSAEAAPIAAGRLIFAQRCASCHSLDQGVIQVGPTLWGIADTAWYRVPGMSPQDYIRDSILNPGAYVVEGFADVMQKNLGEMLSSTDVDHVIAFLMTFEADAE